MGGGSSRDEEFCQSIARARMQGDPTMDALFSNLYERIKQKACRQLARERQAHTLQAIELVSEAYIRLQSVRGLEIRGRTHALRLVARAIRHVLIDWARRRNAEKHGGHAEVVTLTTAHGKTATPMTDIIALHRALDEMAQGQGNLPREAQVIELYFFAGASPNEIATILNMSERQVFRDYRHARVWLHRRIGVQGDLGATPSLTGRM